MNHKKLYRLYREEGLSVRRRRGRKRARGSRTSMPVSLRPGDRWSMDFVSDTFGASRKFRILAINDDCCRENLCLAADTSISGARVAPGLDALVLLHGKPACIVSDNGTDLRAGRSCSGRARTRSSGTISIPESLSRTASSSPSTDHCAMSCSMRNCSTAWPMPAVNWPSGATITTMSGPTHRWGTERLHKRAGHSCRTKASRPTRLRRRACRNIQPQNSRMIDGLPGARSRPMNISGGFSLKKLLPIPARVGSIQVNHKKTMYFRVLCPPAHRAVIPRRNDRSPLNPLPFRKGWERGTCPLSSSARRRRAAQPSYLSALAG